MWIHHIGEIMIGVFVALIIVHFILHVVFKRQRHNRDKQKAETNHSKES